MGSSQDGGGRGPFSEQVSHFTEGYAIGVDVASIERELAELWRQTAEGDVAVSRACLWNLIVFTDSDEAYQRAQQLVTDVAVACPARVLMLQAAPSANVERAVATSASTLRAWISANCQLAPAGGKLLCSEEVTLDASEGGEEHLPPLVRALQVPDVPTALLWLGPPPRSLPRLERLLAGAERLVLDTGDLRGGTEGSGAPAVGLGCERVAALAALLGALPRLEVADLGWLRLGPLRLLLASFFDPPVGASPLLTATRVRLECSESGLLTAMLMIGWIASRLGWSAPVSAGAMEGRPSSARWLSSRPGGAVAIELAVVDGAAGRHGIVHLGIESQGGERFEICHRGQEALELRGTGLPTRVLAATERTEAELLVAALGVRGHDPLFPVALAQAAQLRQGARVTGAASTPEAPWIHRRGAVELHRFPSRRELERAAAARVVRLAREARAARGRFAWGLVGGTLAPSVYALIAEQAVEWSTVDLYWGDERAVPRDHPDSNYGQVKAALVERALAGGARVHAMWPAFESAATPEVLAAAAERYESLLLGTLGAVARLDLLHVGMGPDGHLCSLFPGHPLLQERTRWVASLSDSPKPPPARVTLTLRTILAAREVCFLAAGADKAAAVREVLHNEDSPLPAAIVTRQAPRVLWLLDAAAAGQLGAGADGPQEPAEEKGRV
jgi:6-phosphogluconolactonase